MKPLQSVALGLVFLVLESRVGGFDVYADPVGWVLIVYGVRGLGPVPRGDLLRGTALLAGLVSLPLWVPAVDRALADADPALAWAADLPRFGFWLVLCLSLAEAAMTGGEPRAAAWWRVVEVGVGAVIALPGLVFGAGLTGLEGAAGGRRRARSADDGRAVLHPRVADLGTRPLTQSAAEPPG